MRDKRDEVAFTATRTISGEWGPRRSPEVEECIRSLKESRPSVRGMKVWHYYASGGS